MITSIKRQPEVATLIKMFRLRCSITLPISRTSTHDYFHDETRQLLLIGYKAKFVEKLIVFLVLFERDRKIESPFLTYSSIWINNLDNTPTNIRIFQNCSPPPLPTLHLCKVGGYLLCRYVFWEKQKKLLSYHYRSINIS